MIPTPCPVCSGLNMLDHPAGPLTFQHDPECMILASEDARAVVDSDRLLDVSAFVRDVTKVEKILLGTLGYVGAEAVGIQTLVRGITPGVRHRSWPQLRQLITTPEGN